jgi:hypothetical protein
VNPANQYTLGQGCIARISERELASSIDPLEIAGQLPMAAESNTEPGQVTMEIQEFVNGVGGMPVTLYDGASRICPACVVVAASSINLIGTMRAINLTNLGSGWVVSTPPAAALYAPGGHHGRGGRVPLERTGKVVFYTGIQRRWRRADRGELPHHWQGGGARGEHRQPAGACAGRIARRGRVDRLGDQSRGAQFRGLPECGAGD